MKPLASKPALALASVAALVAVAGLIALEAQEPQAPAPPAAGGGQAKGQAKGKGRGAVDTLGDGPWDLPSEKGSVHVSVVTKGLDHPW